MKSATILTVYGVLAGGVDAFWRMPCKGRTGLARIDPLVNFGQVADHVHAIHGSNGFSTTATTDDLLAGDCTSCEVTQDKSAYWHPALYFKKSDGNFKVVEQVGGMLAYYLLEPIEAKLTAYPKGFEMLAGDTNQRNFSYPIPDIEKSLWSGEYVEQPFLRQWALGFNCLNYNAAPEAALYRHFMPDKAFLDQQCTQGIRLELMFPSCWDGKNLDGINHDKKSHVAYPALGNTGACPEGFPVRLPTLFYESIWNTFEFKGQDGQFVFANGDPTGNGYHGDFITGWDEDFLQKAVDQCKNLSGLVSDCPLFNLQTETEMDACEIPTAKNDMLVAAFKEEVDNVNALPGDVPINAGPAYANGNVKKPVTSAPAPTLDYSPAPSVDPTEYVLPGGVLQETVKSEAAAAPTTTTTKAPEPAAPTPIKIQAVEKPAAASSSSSPIAPAAPETTAPPTYEPANTQAFVSTEYITKDRKVYQVYYVEELVTVTGTTTVTSSVVEKRHLHRHRRSRRNY